MREVHPVLRKAQSGWALLFAAATAALLTYALTANRHIDDTPSIKRPQSARQPAAALPSAHSHARSVATPVGDDRSIATGNIHFERPASGSRSLAGIDITVRGAVGVWQPSAHRLRVVLLDRAATPADLQFLKPNANTEDVSPVARPSSALLELHFVSTAQAFDRDELESASLTARGDADLASTADILNSIEWSGSLPSLQALSASSEAVLHLTANGSAYSSDQDTWRQIWNISVQVPVFLVD